MEVPHINDAQQAIAYDSAAIQEQPISPLRKWGSLVVLSLALAIIVIDTTLLNVSLKTIINDLHTTIEAMQWVITAYSLVLAAFTITGGRLGDLYGRKKMFMLGAVIFAIGSFLASISKNVGTMIAGEAIIEGIGAALMMPATASILVANFKGKERGIAFGIWGGIAAASSAIGPILGGWLTTNYSWRWGFRINVVVAAILLLGSVIVRESRDTEEKNRIDFIGVILSALGMLSIVFAFIKANTYGWIKAKAPLVLFHHTLDLGSLSVVPLFIALGLVILVLFILWERYLERSGKTPLVSLELLKNYQFTVGTLTTAVISLGMAGLIFSIPVFLQTVRNLDALHTGLTMLPLSIALLVAAPIAGFLAHKTQPKYIIQIGLALNVVGYLLMRYILHVDSTVWQLAPGFIVLGIGLGLTMSQISNITLSAVSVQQAGEASGVNNTMRQVGQTLGTAVLGAILISSLTSNIASGIQNSKNIPAAVRQTIADKVSSQASEVQFSGGAQLPPGISPQIGAEISAIAKQATTDANKMTLLYGALFSFLGLIIASFLKTKKEAEEGVSAAASQNPSLIPFKHAIGAGVFAIAIIGGLSGVLGYYVGLDKAPVTQTTVTIPVPVPVTTLPVNIPQDQNTSRVPDAPTPAGNTPPAEPATPAAPAPTATPTAATPSSRPETPIGPVAYTDEAWQFGFTAPQNWSVTPYTQSATTKVFYNKTTGQRYGQVDRFVLPAGSENLALVEQQLASSPDITSIEHTTIGGLDALTFTLRASPGKVIAVMRGQVLYYISGDLAGPSVASTLRFN